MGADCACPAPDDQPGAGADATDLTRIEVTRLHCASDPRRLTDAMDRVGDDRRRTQGRAARAQHDRALVAVERHALDAERDVANRIVGREPGAKWGFKQLDALWAEPEVLKPR